MNLGAEQSLLFNSGKIYAKGKWKKTHYHFWGNSSLRKLTWQNETTLKHAK